MTDSGSGDKDPRGLVEQFTEDRKEQHGAMDRRIEKKRFTPRRIALGGLAAAVIAFGAYALLSVNPSSLNVEAGKLTTAPVTYGPFLEYIVEQGAVLPLTTFYLDAVEGGRVEEVFVEQGTHIEEGTPILRLSNANLQLNVMQREAELFREVNRLRETRVTMGQRRLSMRAELVENGIPTAPGGTGVRTAGRPARGRSGLASGIRRGKGQPGIPHAQVGRHGRDVAPGFALPDDPDPAVGGIDRPAAPEPWR